MLDTTATDKALNASDNLGTLSMSVFMVLGGLGIADRYHITADQVLMVFGGIGGIATFVRGRAEKRRRRQAQDRLVELQTLLARAKTNSTGDEEPEEKEEDGTASDEST